MLKTDFTINKYVDVESNEEVKEVLKTMCGLGESLEIKGAERGEARMAKLVSILLDQQKYAEIKKVTTDEEFREECYTLYNI